MELQDILDEIQEGLPPAADAPLNLPVEDVAPEDVNLTENEHGFSAVQLGALEHYKTCLVYRKALQAREVLDKPLALEIFTMLPNLGGHLGASKLTNAPSAHNKTLLTQQLNTYQPPPESILPLFGQLIETVGKTQQTCQDLLPVALATLQTITAEFDRVKDQAIVVFCRKQIDLMTTPLESLLRIDDRLIDFPPYAGELIERLMKVVYSSFYQELYTSATSPTVTELVTLLRCTHDRLQEIHRYCESSLQRLHTYSEEVFTQIDFQDVISQVETVNRYKRLYLTDPVFIEALLSFLKLLK